MEGKKDGGNSAADAQQINVPQIIADVERKGKNAFIASAKQNVKTKEKRLNSNAKLRISGNILQCTDPCGFDHLKLSFNKVCYNQCSNIIIKSSH